MEVSHKPFARKTPDQLVYLELGSGNGGMLLSVSEEGFRFRAVSPLRPLGLVPFAFSFDGTHRLQGVGEIEWLDDDGRSGGMRFADVSNEFRAALDQWLLSPSRHARSGREVTPGAAIPLDTMEKIRADLRRGYAPAADPPATPSAAQQEAVPVPGAQEGEPRPEAEPEFEAPLKAESKAAATPGVVRASEPKRQVRETPSVVSPRAAMPMASRPLRPHFSQPAMDPSAASAREQAGPPKAPRQVPAPPPEPAAATVVPAPAAAPRP